MTAGLLGDFKPFLTICHVPPGIGDHLVAANSTSRSAFIYRPVSWDSENRKTTDLRAKKSRGELSTVERILGDEAPVDSPFIQELPGEVKGRSEICPAEVEIGRRKEEWRGKEELWIQMISQVVMMPGSNAVPV